MKTNLLSTLMIGVMAIALVFSLLPTEVLAEAATVVEETAPAQSGSRMNRNRNNRGQLENQACDGSGQRHLMLQKLESPSFLEQASEEIKAEYAVAYAVAKAAHEAEDQAALSSAMDSLKQIRDKYRALRAGTDCDDCDDCDGSPKFKNRKTDSERSARQGDFKGNRKGRGKFRDQRGR